MTRNNVRTADRCLERRASRRFSIQLPLWGWLVGKTRTLTMGETINISSLGVLFAAQEPVAVGTKLEVHIDWPLRSRKGELMELAGLAFVVRSTQFVVAARFSQCALQVKEPNEIRLFSTDGDTRLRRHFQ